MTIDLSSIYTALKYAQHIRTWIDTAIGKTVITLDLDLYFRALQLVQSDDAMRNKFVLRLGELHAVFSQLRAIGRFIDNSGIDEAWIQADVFDPVVVKQILTCSHMKRAIMAHEINL